MIFRYNQLAKGFNNLTGLVNLESVSVKGNYFLAADDRYYEGGIRTVSGIGKVKNTGSPATQWRYEFLSDEQIWYLSTQFLDGQISGPVTMRTWRNSMPLISGMQEQSIIANAIMTLPTPRTGNRYESMGYQADLFFTNIEVIMSCNLYGQIYVANGVTAQTAIGTTPVKLTGFATNGLYNGMIVDASSDSIKPIVSAKYKPSFNAQFTSTVATSWTFEFYKNGVATGSKIVALSTSQQITLAGLYLDLTSSDTITVYVNSSDGGGTATITLQNATFSLESVSLV